MLGEEPLDLSHSGAFILSEDQKQEFNKMRALIDQQEDRDLFTDEYERCLDTLRELIAHGQSYYSTPGFANLTETEKDQFIQLSVKK